MATPVGEISIVRQGILLKRGEFIRTWRPRFFQLKTDGSLRGYKSGPPSAGDMPLNFFDLTRSVIVPFEEKKKKGFVIRFTQMTAFVERVFLCETDSEADEWITALHEVTKSLALQQSVIDEQRHLGPNEQVSRDLSLEDFELLKVLGKGSFGKVLMARDKATRELVAIKVLKKEMILQKDELDHTLTENRVLHSTNHPFLTCLRASFQTRDNLFFVMEYVNGGELFFHLQKEKRFAEDRVRFYISEILSALTYLHSRDIIYRDLKLENLLLDAFGNIKITDFGLCKSELAPDQTTQTFCGTPEYLAPEVLEDAEYGRSVDWWGMGVVMFEMLCGRLPFYDRNHDALFDKILHAVVEYPSFVSAHAKALLEQLLIKDPIRRLGSGPRDGLDIMDQPFFSSIDFAALDRLELRPPFVPRVSGETDTSYFDPMFTSEQVRLSPSTVTALDDDKDTAFSDFHFAQKGES